MKEREKGENSRAKFIEVTFDWWKLIFKSSRNEGTITTNGVEIDCCAMHTAIDYSIHARAAFVQLKIIKKKERKIHSTGFAIHYCQFSFFLSYSSMHFRSGSPCNTTFAYLPASHSNLPYIFANEWFPLPLFTCNLVSVKR